MYLCPRFNFYAYSNRMWIRFMQKTMDMSVLGGLFVLFMGIMWALSVHKRRKAQENHRQDVDTELRNRILYPFGRNYE